MDPIRHEIRSILSFLSYYEQYLLNTRRTRRALNRFLDLLDNCPPHPISEEQRWEALQIYRILGGSDQAHNDRLNQLLSQVFQNEPDQKP